jgi:hypothetical protein
VVRQSKQGERRSVSPRRCRAPSPKTGRKEDNLPEGFKVHENAIDGVLAKQAFIPKIKGK